MTTQIAQNLIPPATQTSKARTGGSYLAEALQRSGLGTVFTLHGGHLDAFFVECRKYGISLTDTRHEATAGHAAAGYAKATGTPAVAVVTSGPGFLNVVTAVGDAFLDRVPMIVIAGAPPLRESERNLLQAGIDQIGMIKPVTKFAFQVTHPWRIPEIVGLAKAKATEGVPGPVLIEVPIDVLFDEAPEAEVRFPSYTAPGSFAGAAESQVAEAAELLTQAQRPLVFVGGGVTFAQAQEDLRALAEGLGLPVCAPNKSEGIIAHDAPEWGGGLGTAGALAMQGKAPDVVLMLGLRQGMFSGGAKGFFPDAAIIQVDIDGSELGRIFDVEVPIAGDCRDVLQQLRTATESEATAGEIRSGRQEWLTTVRTARDSHAVQFADPKTETGRMHPYHASKAVIDALPEDVTYVLDGGENAPWATYHLKARNVGDVLRIGYLGCLGVGQGYAMGAYTANPRTTVIFTGDGALGFNIQEFEAMVRHRIPIITVVYNNKVWGMSIHGQQAVYGEEGVVVSRLEDSDYHKVCEAFGGYGERVTALEDIPGAVQRAIDSGLPACLNLEIDPEVIHPTTLRLLGDIDNPDEIVVPYYSNFPRR
ncbi:thiamine pyrophosphate-binding protein [Brevibacterium sp. NPDC049920]|uniref:thiamine pyrophosphate-binding protein n=2 Tax=Bacteria TaxID=2 RepID=UPI0025DD76A2|nr:thiamine pyrophosphate-binding protein [uncultured Brevibacterium sp.]